MAIRSKTKADEFKPLFGGTLNKIEIGNTHSVYPESWTITTQGDNVLIPYAGYLSGTIVVDNRTGPDVTVTFYGKNPAFPDAHPFSVSELAPGDIAYIPFNGIKLVYDELWVVATPVTSGPVDITIMATVNYLII